MDENILPFIHHAYNRDWHSSIGHSHFHTCFVSNHQSLLMSHSYNLQCHLLLILLDNKTKNLASSNKFNESMNRFSWFCTTNKSMSKDMMHIECLTLSKYLIEFGYNRNRKGLRIMIERSSLFNMVLSTLSKNWVILVSNLINHLIWEYIQSSMLIY